MLISEESSSVNLETVEEDVGNIHVSGSMISLEETFGGSIFSPRQSATIWNAVLDLVNIYIRNDHRQRSLVLMKKRGVNIWSPAVYFYLNNVVDTNDWRFSSTFLFPGVDEQHFRNTRPVGMFLLGYDNSILMEDRNCTEIFGGSILEMHFYELFASLLGLLYSFLQQIPALFVGGKVWRRDVLHRCDGTRMLGLLQLIDNGNEILVFFQDQSDLFPSVLENICFI